MEENVLQKLVKLDLKLHMMWVAAHRKRAVVDLDPDKSHEANLELAKVDAVIQIRETLYKLFPELGER